MMWGSGLTHGLWMVVGWVLGLLAVAIAVYAGVRLASRQMISRLIHEIQDIHEPKEGHDDHKGTDCISKDA